MVWSIYEQLSQALATLSFEAPVTHVYNPLVYACVPAKQYIDRYVSTSRHVVLLGMNPGPWGMVQTGVPFGEVSIVRTWLGIDGTINRPKHEHPARPVEGFRCQRSEVSGARLWGWAKDTFETPERFFATFTVINYCPLAFMESSGKNFTPDKIRASERTALMAYCDEALSCVLAKLEPKLAIGIGTFAEACLQRVLGMGTRTRIGRMLHPSPASPRANGNWAKEASAAIEGYGIELPNRERCVG